MKILTVILLKIIFCYSPFANAEVKIAALFAESGPVSDIAKAIAEAKRVAVDTINADGIGIVGKDSSPLILLIQPVIPKKQKTI